MKIRAYPSNHPQVAVLKERANALKWLLVVCFGFLGYKNARYGRIEAHESVTKGGREVLLRAKEVAEEEGFEVLHMYVDALWIKKKGCNKPEHFAEVITHINERTGLTIKPGQRVRFVYTQGQPDVLAWELGGKPDHPQINKAKYIELLAKAGAAVLLPFGVDPKLIMEWSLRGGIQLPLTNVSSYALDESR